MIITYLDLLNKIANKEINPYNYIVVYNDTSYSYNGLTFVDVNKIPLVQRLTQSESAFINLTVVLYKLEDISNTKSKEDNTIRRAKKDIIDELWDMYLSLDWDIDACQGCMNDLDKQFKKVNIYKNLLEFLGINVDKERERKFDKWYKEQIYKQNKEQKEKEKLLQPIKYDWKKLTHIDTFSQGKDIASCLVDINFKINEIINYLNKEKQNKE